MNREIKFRGQRTDTKEWVYGSLIHVPQSGNSFVTVIVNTNASVYSPLKEYGQEPLVVVSGFWNRVIPDTVSQYTGLKDGKHSDGKSIFEGDICKDNKGDIVVIEWNNEKTMFSCRIIKGGGLTKGMLFPLWQWNECEMNGYRYLEVIGNIYENPELLTQLSKS